MGEIVFDFYTAEQVLRQTEEMTERMKTEILQNFREVTQQISESWSGEAGNRFFGVAERELERLEQTEKMMKFTAESLQDAVHTAKITEEQTKEIAELRTY